MAHVALYMPTNAHKNARHGAYVEKSLLPLVIFRMHFL
jgi:hypothetical protein